MTGLSGTYTMIYRNWWLYVPWRIVYIRGHFRTTSLDSMTEALNSVDGVSNNNDTSNKGDQVHGNDISELSKPIKSIQKPNT